MPLPIGWHKQALAQGYSVTLAQLATRMTAQETKTQFFSVTGNATSGGNVIVTKANLQVRNGQDDIDFEETNGFGNLILGYNEIDGQYGSVRTGSHNVVVGPYNSYSSYNGLVVGIRNSIANRYASAVGGTRNAATGSEGPCVTGGAYNTAASTFTTVSGGFQHTAGSALNWVGGTYFQSK